MSTRNRTSTASATKIDRLSLALNESYEEEIAPLLTTIDQIRNRVADIDTTIDLPAIVVIGEQSSGKSSVLEALSGIPLPRGGQHMTTKCPLELRMRRSSTWHASLECSGHVIQDNIVNSQEINRYVTQEQNRLTHNRDQISKKVLLLNIQAPWLPNLTLIDLPGIIQVTSKQQDSGSVNMIEELIQEYLDRPSTIILAIIQACNDIETSAAIKYAKMFDPDGERTIGVLTKLDLVDRGAEQKLLEVFENKRMPLKHGYLMVKCRSQEDIDNNIDLNEALRKEDQFFSKSSKFQSVPIERRGCPSLARFLTRELVRSIKQSLPRLITDLRTKINNIEQQFRQLGIDDYTQLLLTNDARLRHLTDKLFSAMQLFRTEIHGVEEGAQVNNPLYAKRNELNQQFYNEMHNCKFENTKLLQLIKSAMIATQGPEPADYILFRVTKTVCLNYIKSIRLPMQQYLSNMLERTHDVISTVINRVFHMRPNLLIQMRLMHENIERQLKVECQRELELILEMEESFVYADHPLYKDTLKRTKRLHKQNSNESVTTTIIQSARIPYTTANASTNSITTLKRTNGALSEDNDDDAEDDMGPPVKISRPNSTSTNRLTSYIRPTIDHVSSSRPAILPPTTTTTNDNFIDEEIIEYKIRILTMQDIICQRIVLTFPQRIEYQL
jgi:interferon-induced GTP-binding protein Mx1